MSLPPVWKARNALKQQQLTTLQRVFEDTALRLSIHDLFFATPGLLKLNLTIGFCINHRDDLGTGNKQLCLGYHTYAARKLM